MKRHVLLFAVAVAGMLATLSAQPPLFTTALPKEEFAARRAKVFDQIGDGVVVIQGGTETVAYEKFRQTNQFFYLTGIEVPRSMLMMDGRTKTSTLYIMPISERMERTEGPLLKPGAEAERLSGIEHVVAHDEFEKVAPSLTGRVVYTTFRGETAEAGTPDREASHAAARKADVWDQRPSREEWFMNKLREKAPGVQFKNLDPILDAMRQIKSPREIALLRQSSRIAGEAMMEAMRSAEPGMYEYEIEALGDYIFKKNNAHGPAYFALVADGTNAAWPHYHAAQSQLKSGDLVLFDYAPDYQYYTSDVTRMFPANGKFTPAQRELYGVYLELYRSILTSIRPAPTRDILRDAVKKMDDVMARYTFTNPKYKAAAQRFVDGYHRRVDAPPSGRTLTLGHMVGMETHDVQVPFDAYAPGMVFTIEPALTIPEDHVYIRLEDMLVITKDGYDNMSAFAPEDPDAIEKLMAEPGLAQWKPGH
ncbi:MAG TPA: Xaa-Pro aminopeptidase [Vicinamibacterales bacterium]|nr:Xaa-Pro aminopeptidase [Vicinamibacterales bacterium]